MPISKGKTAMQKQLLIRLVVTALMAWLIAVEIYRGTWSRVWIGMVCWVVLYWVWNWGHGKGTPRPFWGTVLRRIIILVAGALALFVLMFLVMVWEWEIDHRHQVATQVDKTMIEKNKVRKGMTINDVLRLVHVGMDITASAVVDCDKVYCAPDEFRLVQHKDGTFILSGYLLTEQVSGNLTPSQDHERMTKPEQVLGNLTESQAAELMNQKMSDGYEWRWEYRFVQGTLTSTFSVTFGRDGRVKDITDVGVTDLRNHRA